MGKREHKKYPRGIEIGIEAEVTVRPHQDVGVEEIDAATYYNAVGQFEFKVENSYKIKYSYANH